MNTKVTTLRIGWAQADLTPAKPVAIIGQFFSRISEGVENALTATALVMESSQDHAVFVSCDLVGISQELQDAVRARLSDGVQGLDPHKVILHATHTHAAPEAELPKFGWSWTQTTLDLALPVTPAQQYIAFAAERIANIVTQAWNSRSPGQISFGLGHAVVGRNRRWVNTAGVAQMYGNTDTPEFSHIEGYEDHTVGVLAARDEQGQLTGLVVNVPCTSQVKSRQFQISADYWHETRQELRRRLGQNVFVLAQCSAAGDQSPRPIYEKRTEDRMLALAGRTECQEIAQRIADAVDRVLATLADHPDTTVPLRHHVEQMQLPLHQITQQQLQQAKQEIEIWRKRYESEAKKLQADPSLRDLPRWYVDISEARTRMHWLQDVIERYQQQKDRTSLPYEVHILRLGDIAIATNPLEYYLDFGIFIKARSPAAQTFLVQLAGSGGYVPTMRSVQGGGYGSVPASYILGPEGGRLLAENTIERMHKLWA